MGTVQAALNTGRCDHSLASRGFSGAQLKAKLKGFWGSIASYASATKETLAGYVGAMRSTLAWCETIVGSVTTALDEQIKSIPGGAAACEALREFIQLLQNAAESSGERKGQPSQETPIMEDKRPEHQR